MNPGFRGKLAACSTQEDLFYLCKDESGFVEPDAFGEIRARGLLGAYEDWLLANTTRVQGGYMCRSGKHLWSGQADAVRCCDGLHTRCWDAARERHYWLRNAAPQGTGVPQAYPDGQDETNTFAPEP